MRPWRGRVGLAVSGGPDSMVLMHLAAAYAQRRRQPMPVVYTVDHGLRAESADEAQMVAEQAENLGLRYRVLRWSGPKPTGNRHALARAARYRLMGAAMREDGVQTLLTGHMREDQAETFLLRLARGSGLDGLCAMAADAPFPDSAFAELRIGRPLLDISRAEILATAQAMGLTFVEDPSNRDVAYQRTHARAVLQALAPLGIEAHKIAQTAEHLQSARAALEGMSATLFAQAVRVDGWGYALVDRSRLRGVSEDLVLRVLGHVFKLIGGDVYAPEFASLKAVHAWMEDDNSPARGRTLGGCRLQTLDSGEILVAREAAAQLRAAPTLTLRPGESGLWDGRFRIQISAKAKAGPYVVKPLGIVGLKTAKDKGALVLPSHEPHRVAITFAGVWLKDRLIAIPAPTPWGLPEIAARLAIPSILVSTS